MSCVFGVLLGIVVSPIMWLTYYDPILQSINPLCKNQAKTSPRSSITSTAAMDNGVQQEGEWVAQGSWNKQYFNLTAANALKFNLDSNFTVNAPSDGKTRYRTLSRELAPRKLLFIGVVTAEKYLDTRVKAINNTWGRGVSDLFYFSSHPHNDSLQLPIITLPGVNDSIYPPQRKVYHMLKYMHDHYIDEYDFFMRSDDDVYVKTDLLLELLSHVNPAQDIYMGCPGFGRPDDKSRIKLNEDEHYCMGGPGVIFSRSAPSKLAPHLDTCLEVRASFSSLPPPSLSLSQYWTSE